MRQVVSTAEGIKIIDVPAPMLMEGEVLVEVEFSFVSTGTELATLDALKAQTSGMASYVVSNPSLLGKAVDLIREKGVLQASDKVVSHLRERDAASDRIEPIGYSCSGRVIEVGENVSHVKAGDRVACAGAGLATHSELVSVPENLVSVIPRGSDMRAASSVAVGAIAMQGVRRSDIRLGEKVIVIGLGLVGLLTVQLLKLSGARVFGFDLDVQRVRIAESLGVEIASSEVNEIRGMVERNTGYHGVDATVITASEPGNDVVELAMDLTRKRGKVVVVGLVGMNIQRDPFLRKEIDFVASSSYGPGRYDERYERHGVDYPYSFVRWTEKRNMDEYARLIATGGMDVTSFTEEFPLDSAMLAYERLASSDGPVSITLRYKPDQEIDVKRVRKVVFHRKFHADRPSIAIVGAGKFLRRVHLPALKKLQNKVQIGAIVGRNGVRVTEIANQYGAGYASTSVDEVLSDESIDAVVIGSRHDTHADLVGRSLEAGKHVFVEKPLAITEAELESVTAIFKNKPDRLLMTGFNRRFSPSIIALDSALEKRTTPLIMAYQMNVGYLSPDHWLRNSEGGGRNLGEACHVYDIFTQLTGAEVEDVHAKPVALSDDTHSRNENFSVSMAFSDGSIGSLIFTSLGSSAYPKETLQVYVDQTVYNLTDYSHLERMGLGEETLWKGEQDKGHSEQIGEFVDALISGETQVPAWQQFQSTRVALLVEGQLSRDVESL